MAIINNAKETERNTTFGRCLELLATSRFRMCCVLIGLALSISPVVALGQGKPVLVIIVHPQTEIDDLSMPELRDLYLGNVEEIKGIRLKPIMYTANTPIRILFESLVLKRDPEAFAQHWRSKRFLGSWQKQPTSFKSTKAVKAFVAEEKGAIAYIPLSEIDATVRQVQKIDGREVGDRAYPLRSTP